MQATYFLCAHEWKRWPVYHVGQAIRKEEKLTEPATIEVTNMPYIELRIIKEDFDTGEVLEGAHFDLVRLVTKRSLVEGEDPSIIEEIVKEDECTDGEGCITISGLKPGEYKLVEKKAPNGYVLPKGSIQLVKLDRCNPQKTLAGAIFNLYWLNPEIEAYELLVKGLVTGSNGKFIIQNLDVGKYKLVETAAPMNGKQKRSFLQLISSSLLPLCER